MTPWKLSKQVETNKKQDLTLAPLLILIGSATITGFLNSGLKRLLKSSQSLMVGPHHWVPFLRTDPIRSLTISRIRLVSARTVE